MSGLVLGIHLGHDATATLIDGNRIVASIAEERLSRRKYHVGFPHRAVDRVLVEADVKPGDVAAVGLSTRRSLHPHHPEQAEATFALDPPRSADSFLGAAVRVATNRARELLVADEAADQQAIDFSRDRTADHLRSIGFTTAEIVAFSHHHAHAASAYFPSGVDRATIFTLDGQGDRKCASVSLAAGGAVTPVMEIPDDTSPGLFYAMVTKFLGYKPNRHEGKITGLAAYGDADRLTPEMSQLLRYDPTHGRFAHDLASDSVLIGKVKTLRRMRTGTNLHMPYMNLVLEWLGERYDPEADAADIAAAAQTLLETVTNEWIAHAIEQFAERPETMLLAGGVFANVRLNQLVAEQHGASEVLIHQNMGDGGLATGAAYLAQAERTEIRPLDHPTVYFGPSYPVDELRGALEQAEVPYTEPDDLAVEVARLLADGKVVARYDGGMEYGPRALGNRSILAAPDDRRVNDWLNERLGRTEFMPFAPAVLESEAADLFVDYDDSATVRASRFMTVTYVVIDEWHDRLQAVVHVDGTARPQVVRRIDNPGYHDIVAAYHRVSGIPAVINTSFNMHEEPIVESPGDAIRAFKAGQLDHLALGPFLCNYADIEA